MALTINTNVASINAQRNLTQSQSALNQSLQRLSTGLRINSAKDDAAGLAISERFTTQIRGLNQAARNANDGISLAQTTESALSEVSNNLQRIRELAIQSANATNSASDREALNNEVQQRLAEIDRIASQTSFNGLKTLDGTFGTATFQVGANVGETIGVTLATGVRSNQIGQIATATGTAVTADAFAEGDLTIAIGDAPAVAVSASVAGTAALGQTDSSAFAKAEAINNSGISGLTATASTEATVAFTAVSGGSAGDTFSFTVNDVEVFTDVSLATAGDSLAIGDLAAGINAVAGQTGVTAAVDGTDIVLTSASGGDITLASTFGGDGAGGLADGTSRGTITLTAAEAIDVDGAGATAAGLSDIGVGTETLDGSTIATVAGANTVISRVDAALTSVSDLRSELGALQSRFESTITNLQTVSESLTASRGRIRDADFAAETANLTKNQILQQAGVSILAQANQQPQLALSLLQ